MGQHENLPVRLFGLAGSWTQLLRLPALVFPSHRRPCPRLSDRLVWSPMPVASWSAFSAMEQTVVEAENLHGHLGPVLSQCP